MYKKEFYMYKPLRTYEDLEYIENYLAQKVWVTKSDLFNDPFEGVAKFAPFKLDTLEKDYREFFEFLFEKFKANKIVTTKEEFNKILQNPTESEKLKDKLGEAFQRFKPVGVICFAACASNIPMWAHYANYHHGYCLIIKMDFDHVCLEAGINEKDKSETVNKILSGKIVLPWIHRNQRNEKTVFGFTKVNYDTRMPKIDLIEFGHLADELDQIDYTVKNSIGVKFKQWEYEQEYRLITNSYSKDESDLMPLKEYAPFMRISGIILGSKLKDQSIAKHLEYLAKKYEVALYQASYSVGEYRITVQKLSDPIEFNYLCHCGCMN